MKTKIPNLSRVAISCTILGIILVSLIATPVDGRQVLIKGTLSMKQKTEIIDTVLSAFDEKYIYPEVALEMEKHVREQIASGKYDDINALELLTVQLTKDLQEKSRDLHIRVSELEPNSTDLAEGDTLTQDIIDTRARRNFEFRKLEWLPGNVGYLKFNMFDDPLFASEKAAAAMRFLADCGAVIIDLRENRGGEDPMVAFILSYFFKEPTHLHSFHYRGNDLPEQVWTHRSVPGRPMYDMELYVLVSHSSASGAEAFTYALKNLKRATIVGETTRGMANPVEFYNIERLGITLKIPTGRNESPITHTSWEGTGVAPDLEVPAAVAFDAAYKLALEKLRDECTDKVTLYSIDWALIGCNAKANPYEPTVDLAEAYVGLYGVSPVTYDEAGLHYRSSSHGDFVLVPLAEHLFGFKDDEEIRARFIVGDDGRAYEMHLLYEDGYVIKKLRTGD